MKKRSMVKTEIHNGVAVPVNQGKSLEELAESSLYDESTEPYAGPIEKLQGKNNLEAAIATLVESASNGDPDARKELLDRVLGKPMQKQQIEQTNLTLVSFLDQIAQDEIQNPEYRINGAEPDKTEDTIKFT